MDPADPVGRGGGRLASSVYANQKCLPSSTQETCQENFLKTLTSIQEQSRESKALLSSSSDEDDAAAAISSVEDKKNLQKNMTDVVIVTDPPPPPLATATAGKTAASVQSSTTAHIQTNMNDRLANDKNGWIQGSRNSTQARDEWLLDVNSLLTATNRQYQHNKAGLKSKSHSVDHSDEASQNSLLGNCPTPQVQVVQATTTQPLAAKSPKLDNCTATEHSSKANPKNKRAALREAFAEKRSVTLDHPDSLTLPLLAAPVFGRSPKRTPRKPSSPSPEHPPLVEDPPASSPEMSTVQPRLPPPSLSSTVETLVDVSSQPTTAAAIQISDQPDNAADKQLARSVSLTSPTTNTAPDLNPEGRRASSLDKPSPNHGGKMVIPTFTVTINPMEEDEVTYDMVPPSTAHPSPQIVGGNHNRPRLDSVGDKVGGGSGVKSIANTTIVVNDDDEDELRRCSIGSASSFQSDPRPKSDNGLLSLGDLGIRRISDISHINEIRREVQGMDHLASEFYEISREPNPDAISLDSIHKRVLKRCKNMYIHHSKASNTNKWFVVITTGCTLVGIVYGFWYKNFGPGALHHSESQTDTAF